LIHKIQSFLFLTKNFEDECAPFVREDLTQFSGISNCLHHLLIFSVIINFLIKWN
jgi:hypothetical protein